ncbi:multidrug ABC transporter ATP-binding protein [Paenibacillus sp. FSL H8-0548]|uniref:ABC transporter ATP-binding protein n=1 Tax=Paenibacillus sp. FSL H8-0548 TaxID=1920422 RepID=UPI00096FC3CB|nr:ABC transporter ATP-binding protein [Paenibacillus sp. FSL H8-0548]OMF27594.1 multidrug ABC transporter ATP-binding protein [Paenibacillus sp. FSL H8-0548]
MLTVQQVSKRFGSFSALEQINLEFENGVYGLLAPNGAGKTTLIKMLATLLHPSEGEILYNGENIIKLDERYREQLGYLPQQFGYYKNYSPRKYLLYLAALKGIKAAIAKPKIVELLKLVALEEVMDKKMKKFSGGMIQRVGIAQAMLNDPRVLILDEPTAGLDPKERVRFRNMLTALARNRIVILSTHIVSDVESIANEIIMIKDRRVLHKDSIEKLCGLIEGMVFETTIDYEAVEAFRRSYLSLSEKQESGRLLIRFISSGLPQPDWKAAAPNLEDVFIYIYQDEAQTGEPV